MIDRSKAVSRGLTTLGSLIGATSVAQGAIVYIQQESTAPVEAGSSILWDIDGGNTVIKPGLSNTTQIQAAFASYANIDAGLFVQTAAIFLGAQVNTAITDRGGAVMRLPGTAPYIAALALNETVSAAVLNNPSPLGDGLFQAAHFPVETEQFFGFSFKKDGNTHYGWGIFRFSLTGIEEFAMTLGNWAYEDTPNTPIQAGAIPEPSMMAAGLAVLAAGAVGVRRWRSTRAARHDMHNGHENHR